VGSSDGNWLKALVTVVGTVTAALLALCGVIGVAIIEGRNSLDLETEKARFNQQLEQQKFESSLIVKAIETGDLAVAQTNLLFLLDAGFIHDPTGTIRTRTKLPESAPVLPAGTGAPTDRRPLAAFSSESILASYSPDAETNFSGWATTAGWTVREDGLLTNAGTQGRSYLRAPWQPQPGQDYAVEAEIRALGCTRTAAGSGFGVVYAETPGTLWWVNLCGDDPASPSRQGEWLTQRTEIRGNLINQCRDGAIQPIFTAGVAREQTSHSGRSQFSAIGLMSDLEHVEVRSFRVLRPSPDGLCK
jgi:hypothetical protein